MPGLDGPAGVTVRCIGWAVPGAVAVEGGADCVCEPRLPELFPPPGRASTALTLSARTLANIVVNARRFNVLDM
jgi:hypothetical protein